MTKTTRRLPVLTETSIAETKALRLSLAQNYQLQLQSRTDTISCRPGCHNCCKHPVYLSLLEGVLTYRAIVKQGKWITLKPKLIDVSKRTWGLSSEVWAMSDLACPLLEGGLCAIYEARPFSCHVAYSVGSPDNCRPVRFDGSFLPKTPMIELFSKEESTILQRHKTRLFRLPLASAALWGERIDQGTLALEDSFGAIVKEPSNG
jgi:Fe-S-cluster containining protein